MNTHDYEGLADRLEEAGINIANKYPEGIPLANDMRASAEVLRALTSLIPLASTHRSVQLCIETPFKGTRRYCVLFYINDSKEPHFATGPTPGDALVSAAKALNNKQPEDKSK